MNQAGQMKRYSVFLNIMAWGTMWGIFEATAGYLLHLLPVSIGWLIWYPVAVFFMANVYRRTGKLSSILLVGVLCAAIKLLNLLLPVRVDKVINPAISIIFEALAMAAVLFAVKMISGSRNRSPLLKALAALGMNTGWRLMYMAYLLLLAPGWIREVSVISSAEQFIPFFVTQNLITSLILFLGYQFKHVVFRPAESLEQTFLSAGTGIPARTKSLLKTGAVVVMLLADAALGLLL